MFANSKNSSREGSKHNMNGLGKHKSLQGPLDQPPTTYKYAYAYIHARRSFLLFWSCASSWLFLNLSNPQRFGKSHTRLSNSPTQNTCPHQSESGEWKADAPTTFSTWHQLAVSNGLHRGVLRTGANNISWNHGTSHQFPGSILGLSERSSSTEVIMCWCLQHKISNSPSFGFILEAFACASMLD